MKLKALALIVAVMMIVPLAACSTTPTATTAPASSAPAESAAPATSAAATASAAAPTQAATGEVTTYSFLMCWNGGASAFPDGWDKGVVSQALQAKTGVALKVETITSSEKEKLATVFASGDLPDITNAPYWSTDPGGEGELIKNAGAQGMLLPLKSMIDKYPNVKRLYDVGVISQKYLDKYINNSEYNGEIYVIPTQTGRGKEDVRNWAYNLFARKDILDKLSIKPESVTTEDAIYDLLKKIKAGSFTDINGKPVIPGSTWHNGWNYADFLRGFNNGGVTGWAKQSDGTLVNDIFTDNYVNKVLYMRKLVAEGLMDAECFTQTDTQAKEKLVTGRVAVFGCHYPNEYGFFKSTLYKTNPEMTYVPLGPILDQKGGVPTQVERIGRSGSPVIFFSKNIKDPEKAMSYVDYINSDEGLILTKFGIEGQTYTMDNGVPKYTDEALKTKADDTAWNLMGFGIGGQFIGADPSFSKGWDADYLEAGYVHAREVNPLKFIEGTTADDVVDSWSGKKAYDEKMSTISIDDELKKAFLTKSDDEAKAVIENIRSKMKAAGYEDMAKYVNEQVKADPKILN